MRSPVQVRVWAPAKVRRREAQLSLFSCWPGRKFSTMYDIIDQWVKGASEDHGEAEVCADQAACERGDDRARRPRQDEFDGGHHQDAGLAGALAGALL